MDKETEDRANATNNHAIRSPSKEGITLLGRRPSTTVLSSDVVDSNQAGQDHLLETRSFYGLTPSHSTQTLHPKRTPSKYSHRSRSNSKTGSQSIFSGTSRPTSPPISVSTTPVSPPRTAVPLPTPRAFLTPQKPKAALRAEENERAKASKENLSSNATNEISESKIPHEVELGSQQNKVEEHAVEPSQSTTSFQNSTDEHVHYPPSSPPRPSVEFPSLRRSSRDIASSENLVRPSNTATSLTTTLHARSPHRVFNKSTSNPEDLPIHHTNGNPHASQEEQRRKRRYQTFENPLTTFFCGGHLMTGGDDYWSILLALFLLFGMTGLWIGTTGRWMWLHGSEYGLITGGGVGVVIVFIYLFGLTFSSFLVASFRDPGILPRGLDLNPPVARFEEDSYESPLDRSFPIGKGRCGFFLWTDFIGHTQAHLRVTVRWCETCKTYRPPRASHCRMCGNCVDSIDHHCAYLHNCVGRRNYLSFIVTLIAATISAIYIVIFSAIHFWLICRHENVSFAQAIRDSPGAAISFLIGVIILPAMLFLLGYHSRLMIFNITTVEQIRENASKNLLQSSKRPSNNPFTADSKWRNVIIFTLGRPQIPSYINASGWEKEDKRKVNPGLLSQLDAAKQG